MNLHTKPQPRARNPVGLNTKPSRLDPKLPDRSIFLGAYG